MAQTKIAQGREKDFDAIVPDFSKGFCDMTDQVKNDILEICRESCKMQHDGELKYYKDMAMHIKKEVDKKLGGSWHIIVGKYELASLTQLQEQTSVHLSATNTNASPYSGWSRSDSYASSTAEL